MRIFNVSFIFIISILDILKELNCGYYECGEVVIDRSKISSKYLISWRFVYDLLGSVSLMTEIIDSHSQTDVKYVFKIVKLLIFFKLSLVIDVIKRIESHFLFSNTWNNWIHLFKLIIIVIFSCHIMAILYYVNFI